MTLTLTSFLKGFGEFKIKSLIIVLLLYICYSLLSLETTLLSNDAGEAEVFGLNTDGFHSQRVYLENLFKGNEALVESIIDSIKTVSQIPKTHTRHICHFSFE